MTDFMRGLVPPMTDPYRELIAELCREYAALALIPETDGIILAGMNAFDAGWREHHNLGLARDQARAAMRRRAAEEGV